MKKLIMLSLVLISIFAKAQNNLNALPLQNDKIIFYRSESALDLTKNTVFARSKQWMANNFGMSMVIQTADSITGRITGDGHFLLKLKGGSFSSINNRFDFKVQVECDNKQYRLSIDSITFTKLNSDWNAVGNAIPLEREVKTSKANANAINMEFENIYFSLIDAIGKADLSSNATPQTQEFYTLPETDGKVVYENIIDMPKKSKDFIYFTATKWVFGISNNVKSYIEVQDQDQGQIIASARFEYTPLNDAFSIIQGTFKFKIQIDCKDNRYRIRLYEITCSYPNPHTPQTMEAINIYLRGANERSLHTNAAVIDATFKEIISSLNVAMTKAAKDDF